MKVWDRRELLFFVALFLEVLAMLISLTTIPYMVNTDICNLFLRFLRYLGYILVLFKILLDTYDKKELLKTCCIILLLLGNALFVGNAVLCGFLFIWGAKNINFEKIAPIMLVWFLAGVIITIGGSQIGFIDDWSYFATSSRPRNAIGYFYPSHAASALLYTVLLFCYVFKQRLKVWHIVLIELLNYWQYCQTDSRTGFVLVLVIPVAFYLLKYLKKDIFGTVLGNILSMAFPISLVVSLFTSLAYHPTGNWQKLNSFLSGRLQLGHDALYDYGVHLFGQKIEWIGYGGLGHSVQELKGTYNYVDCSYIKILLENGIVIWVIFMLGFCIASIYAVRENNKYMALALAFVAGYSIIEPRLIEIGFNPFVLTLVVLIDNNKKMKRILKNKWKNRSQLHLTLS